MQTTAHKRGRKTPPKNANRGAGRSWGIVLHPNPAKRNTEAARPLKRDLYAYQQTARRTAPGAVFIMHKFHSKTLSILSIDFFVLLVYTNNIR